MQALETPFGPVTDKQIHNSAGRLRLNPTHVVNYEDVRQEAYLGLIESLRSGSFPSDPDHRTKYVGIRVHGAVIDSVRNELTHHKGRASQPARDELGESDFDPVEPGLTDRHAQMRELISAVSDFKHPALACFVVRNSPMTLERVRRYLALASTGLTHGEISEAMQIDVSETTRLRLLCLQIMEMFL